MKRVAPAIALAIALGACAAPARAGSPSELYTLNCWGCHQPHAEGIPGTVPRLAHSMAYFLTVPGGREFLVRVPGVANSSLDDKQTAEVLNWLLVTFNQRELPADFKPYTAGEVARLRHQPLLDVKHTRIKLAAEAAAQGHQVAPP
jgi:mono/diheme cytochrome c family protein